MRLGKWGKSIGLIVLIFIVTISMRSPCLFIFFTFGEGPWWFYSWDVETVLTSDEVRNDWSLSPRADKIIFRSEGNYILMFLATEQRHIFKGNKCAGYFWLDNKILICPNLIIDTDDFSETPYGVLNASEANWETVLADAETIYTYKNESGFIFVLATDYKNNPSRNYWVKEVKNVDEVLQGHNYVTVVYPNYDSFLSSEKIFSPNGAYYYLLKGTGEGFAITIYDANDNRKLSQTPEEDVLRYRIGGWAGDSSGVYFQLVGIALNPTQSPLFKLKVP